MANGLSPIFQVGKGGVTPAFVTQVNQALEARELIKITVLESAGVSAQVVCEELCTACGAEAVMVIGGKFVLYRESREKKTIEL